MRIKKNINRLACGILFKNSFKLLDRWGEIADNILFKSNEYFSAEFFPNISNFYTVERSLSNKDGHELRINASSLIFTQAISEGADFSSEYKNFTKRVSECLIPKIIVEYNLITRRIGIVYSCRLDNQEIEKFTRLYFLPEVEGVQDFRFSKKQGTLEGSLFKEKADFINKIYTVNEIKEGNASLSYDYQRHYIPPRAEIRDQIESVFDKSLQGFNNDIAHKLGE